MVTREIMSFLLVLDGRRGARRCGTLQSVATTDASPEVAMALTNSRSGAMQIGALAEQTGVNIETIRYYERVGLLPAPPRSGGRHRLYERGHVQRLSFIRRSRELGFALDDIRVLLKLAADAASDCAATRDIAVRHLSDVQGKIASLRRLERALRFMTEACRPGEQPACPIIEALNGANEPKPPR
jgi:MerR family mercuric resistance operon transcriptional regulator